MHMKKHSIDKLFREKFRDFSEPPDEKVWKSIEDSLDKKKQTRRILPFWWRYAGVAALLLVTFLLFNPLREATPVRVTDSRDATVPETENKRQEIIPSDRLEKEEITKSDDLEQETKDELIPGSDPADADGLAVKDSREKTGPTPGSQRPPIAVAPERTREGFPDVLAHTENGKSRLAESNSPDKKLIAADKRNDALSKITEQPIRVQNDVPSPVGENNEINEEGEKIELLHEKDKKSIFEAISETEEAAMAENKSVRWSVGPRVAPVYFNTIGEGSPIHPNFVSNSKSGNINLSYGLAVAYEIAPKLSLRSGVHKVDYGYDTNDILFTSSLAASTEEQIHNIDYALTSKNLVVESSTGPATTTGVFGNNLEVAAPNPSRNGRMVQQIGYVEVPLELNYALLETKLGLHLIGGISSLFLIDNAVTLESNGGATEIGEANNINSLNFSTNIGIGLDYQISEKLQLNMEPMFKYQLDTFSDASGNFQPFSIGVYSGLSFKF